MNEKIEVLLNEYNALRSEILTAMGARNSILSFGLATVGALVTVVGAIIATAREDLYLFPSIVLMLIVPFICIFVLYIWLGEYQRMHRAGKHIIKLEARINEISKCDLLTWETQLTRNKLHMKYPYNTTILLLIVLAVVSFVCGAFLLPLESFCLRVGIVIMGLIIAIIYYFRSVAKMAELRR